MTINEFAKENGLYHPFFIKKWNGYDVYGFLGKNATISKPCFPLYIISDGNETRLTSDYEGLSIRTNTPYNGEGRQLSANEFAVVHGFLGAASTGNNLGHFKVFSANSGREEFSFVGLPTFILESSTETRFATDTEQAEIMIGRKKIIPSIKAAFCRIFKI